MPTNDGDDRPARGYARVRDRDLTAAEIANVDEQKQTVDMHALRHSFGTLLSKGGVANRGQTLTRERLRGRRGMSPNRLT